jgi:hypothetical protein
VIPCSWFAHLNEPSPLNSESFLACPLKLYLNFGGLYLVLFGLLLFLSLLPVLFLIFLHQTGSKDLLNTEISTKSRFRVWAWVLGFEPSIPPRFLHHHRMSGSRGSDSGSSIKESVGNSCGGYREGDRREGRGRRTKKRDASRVGTAWGCLMPA